MEVLGRTGLQAGGLAQPGLQGGDGGGDKVRDMVRSDGVRCPTGCVAGSHPPAGSREGLAPSVPGALNGQAARSI